jgi:hypothetical protein
MPEEKPIDVEKFFTEQKSLKDRKQAIIADLLKQPDAVMKEFDQKLAKLGYEASENSARQSEVITPRKPQLRTLRRNRSPNLNENPSALTVGVQPENLRSSGL